MLILIGDRILLTNLDFQLRNAKITRFWNRVETMDNYYKYLFNISSNVPRNIGWILWYSNQTAISKNRKITIKDLELSAEQYYVNSIEVFFSANKYMKETFNEKLERYHLNEILNGIIAVAKKNKTEIPKLDSKVFRPDKGRPPTSHFYIEK